MPDSGPDDFALPLLTPEAFLERSAWEIEPSPTTLIGYWRDDAAAQPPTRAEVALALGAVVPGFNIVEETLAPATGGMVWSMGVVGPEALNGVVVWCEAIHEPDDVASEFPEMRSCRWVIGMQTMLPARELIAEYAALMRWMVAALPAVCIVLDVGVGGYSTRAMIEPLLEDADEDLPADVLWSVRQFGNTEAREDRVWITTCGLERTGRPELEMLDVPAALAPAAVMALNGIAELSLDSPLSEPGLPFEIGSGLVVTMQPWDKASEHLPSEAPGSRAYREQLGDPDLLGVRAAVCAPTPRGSYRPSWVWPMEVVQRIAENRAVLFSSERATRRQERLARATWPELAMAFASLARQEGRARPEGALFLVKAGFTDEAHPEHGREHLWFLVERFEGDRLDATLLNTPVAMKHLHEGETYAIDRAQLTDWLVRTSAGDCVPTDVRRLDGMIDGTTDAREEEA